MHNSDNEWLVRLNPHQFDIPFSSTVVHPDGLRQRICYTFSEMCVHTVLINIYSNGLQDGNCIYYHSAFSLLKKISLITVANHASTTKNTTPSIFSPCCHLCVASQLFFLQNLLQHPATAEERGLDKQWKRNYMKPEVYIFAGCHLHATSHLCVLLGY